MILREEHLALVVQASLLCNLQMMMMMMMMMMMVLILMNYLHYNDKNHKKAKQF